MFRAVSFGDRQVHLPSMLMEYLSYYQVFLYSIKNGALLGKAPVRSVFHRQIYFSCVEAMPKMAALAAIIGYVVITQLTSILGMNAPLVGKILVWSALRELGPVLSAVLIISRSGVAVTSELASMKLEGELGALKLMGVNPMDYLVVPRVLGITVALFLLTIYLQAATIIGGLLLCAALIDISFYQSLGAIFGAVTFADMALSIVKSLVFGAIIASVICYHGLSVGGSITQIPQATIKSVMRCFILVFIANGLITFLVFL